jgi:hypothetical protein
VLVLEFVVDDVALFVLEVDVLVVVGVIVFVVVVVIVVEVVLVVDVVKSMLLLFLLKL